MIYLRHTKVASIFTSLGISLGGRYCSSEWVSRMERDDLALHLHARMASSCDATKEQFDQAILSFTPQSLQKL